MKAKILLGYGTAAACLLVGVLLPAGCSSKSAATTTTTVGVATQLAVITQPSGAANGAPLTTQPSVQLRDASGNAVSTAGVTISAAIVAGGGTLGGTTTATTHSGGLATFTNLSITGTTGNFTLNFTSGSLSSATSTSFALAAGAVTQLGVATQPSASATNGAVFAQQPAVQLRDAQGNAAGSADVVITASLGAGNGALGGTATATTNASGLATFTNLSVTGVAGSKLLNFTSPGLTTAASAAFNLTAGAATQLFLATQPSASVVRCCDIRATARRAAGRRVIEFRLSVRHCRDLRDRIGRGDTRRHADGNDQYKRRGGIHGLAVTGAAGNTTLGFSAPGLAGVTSGAIAIAPPALPSLAGNWSGTWTDVRYGVSGNITNVVLTQSATAFGGTGTIDLSSIGLSSQSGTATGTISGTTVTFNFTAAGVGSGNGTLAGSAGSGTGNITALNFGAFTFTGTASSTQITGTFQFTSPTGGNGTITVTKQ